VRVVAERLTEILGQNVVVENVTGAGGLIGANRLAAARPDGYTLAAMNNSILTILPHIKRKEVKFDSFADYVPIRDSPISRPSSAYRRTCRSRTSRS